MAEESSAHHRHSIKPHPVLPAYYKQADQRPAFVRDLFNRTAPEYNRINKLFSFNSGAWYRGRVLRKAGLRAGMRVLDLAVGTGLVAGQAVEITGSKDKVIGLDLSEGMLAEARRALNIPLVQGRMEELPLAGGSVDFISMGYALRHVADLTTAFREFHRVLRPEGTLVLLEIGQPRTAFSRALLRLYLGRVLPLLSRWTTGKSEAQTLMSYYWDTIESCVDADTITEAMKGAGFASVRCDVEFGLFRAYLGRRPS